MAVIIVSVVQALIVPKIVTNHSKSVFMKVDKVADADATFATSVATTAATTAATVGY